jgi:hypothetical protein
MTLGSTQPVTEMSIFLGGKADNFIAICELIVWEMWESQPLTTLWAFTACYWDSFTFTFIFVLRHHEQL